MVTREGERERGKGGREGTYDTVLGWWEGQVPSLVDGMGGFVEIGTYSRRQTKPELVPRSGLFADRRNGGGGCHSIYINLAIRRNLTLRTQVHTHTQTSLHTIHPQLRLALPPSSIYLACLSAINLFLCSPQSTLPAANR